MRSGRKRNIPKRLALLLFLVAFILLGSTVINAQQPFGDAKKGGRDEKNRMRIRSVLRVTKTTRQPLIEVELYSDREFSALDSAVLLVIGEHVFQGGGYADTKGHVLVFTLTPKEF